MGVKTFAVCQGRYHRAKILKAVCGDLLRSNMLLERQRVDTAELTCVAVGRQRVVCAGGVVATAAIMKD